MIACGARNANALVCDNLISSMPYRNLLFTLVLAAPCFPQAIITTVAGSHFVFDGDGRPATLSPIDNAGGLAVDAKDNLYLIDFANCMVHRVDAVSGTLTVLAGDGKCTADTFPNGIVARAGHLFFPNPVAV